MNDLCLKFADEAEALSVLQSVWPSLESAAEGEYTMSDGARMSIIGVIVRDDVPLSGWHVNVLIAGDVPDAVRPYIIVPPPRARARVWA